MGGVELDLTEARLVAGGSELNLVAVMGVVTVRIPPNVRVEYRGDAITINDQRRASHAAEDAASTNTIWITARTFLGMVQVQLVDREAR
jgi:hypothetical protein